MALFNDRQTVKTIVVKMSVHDQSSIVHCSREVELQVTDIGLNKLPKGIMKGDDTSDSDIEKMVYKAIKPKFEKMTGVLIEEEGHRE